MKKTPVVLLSVFLAAACVILVIPSMGEVTDSPPSQRVSRANRVTVTRMDPGSPRKLAFEQKVTVFYSYFIANFGGARIQVMPMYNGTVPPNVAYGGTGVKSRGSGRGDGYFTILTGSGRVPVNQVRLRMLTPDGQNTIYETIEQVNYLFMPNQSQGGSFKVTRVIVNTLSSGHQGPCPHPFDFMAFITANGSGIVTYRWIHSDGTKSSIKRLRFTEPSSQRVSHTWTINSTGKEHTHWASLEILSPNPMQGNKVDFVCICQ